MTRVVKVLPRAACQLYESAAWWAENRSLDQASHWLLQIESAIASLAFEAERHPKAPEANAFGFPLHQKNFGASGQAAHRNLYTFDKGKVLVFAVRHLAQANLNVADLT